MNTTPEREKSISLTFRGFETPAQDVADLVGRVPKRVGNRGEPVKQGVKTPLTRSYAAFSMSFASDHALCNMLPALLEYLGGVEHLCRVRDQVKAEFVDIHFYLPAMTSDESQDGYLSTATMSDILRLKATPSFGFF